LPGATPQDDDEPSVASPRERTDRKLEVSRTLLIVSNEVDGPPLNDGWQFVERSSLGFARDDDPQLIPL